MVPVASRSAAEVACVRERIMADDVIVRPFNVYELVCN